MLGVGLDRVESTQTMLAFRTREATKVWHRSRHQLVFESVPAPERVHHFHQTVRASL